MRRARRWACVKGCRSGAVVNHLIGCCMLTQELRRLRQKRLQHRHGRRRSAAAAPPADAAASGAAATSRWRPGVVQATRLRPSCPHHQTRLACLGWRSGLTRGQLELSARTRRQLAAGGGAAPSRDRLMRRTGPGRPAGSAAPTPPACHPRCQTRARRVLCISQCQFAAIYAGSYT